MKMTDDELRGRLKALHKRTEPKNDDSSGCGFMILFIMVAIIFLRGCK